MSINDREWVEQTMSSRLMQSSDRQSTRFVREEIGGADKGDASVVACLERTCDCRVGAVRSQILQLRFEVSRVGRRGYRKNRVEKRSSSRGMKSTSEEKWWTVTSGGREERRGNVGEGKDQGSV